MPTGNFEKLATPSEMKSDGICSDLSPFDVPVDTSSQLHKTSYNVLSATVMDPHKP